MQRKKKKARAVDLKSKPPPHCARRGFWRFGLSRSALSGFSFFCAFDPLWIVSARTLLSVSTLTIFEKARGAESCEQNGARQ